MLQPVLTASLVAALALPAIGADLYLIAAAPSDRADVRDPYPALILNVDREGKLAEREIVPAEYGVAWLGLSYDDRRAVIITGTTVTASGPGTPKILVVDLNK